MSWISLAKNILPENNVELSIEVESCKQDLLEKMIETLVNLVQVFAEKTK